MEPIYSICMCNYNMARTLDRAVSSVAAQLDDRFEIVLVDDGSSDDSVSIMHELALQYPIIRVVALPRDRRRKLGETFNVSIREASGTYCLLHIDCDDVWGPHLIAWVEVFHQIESAMDMDILLSGQQVKMAKRSLLLNYGAYPNIFRAQDLAMQVKFSNVGILWFLDHEVFRTRLQHPKMKKWYRVIIHTIDYMINDLRYSQNLYTYVRLETMNSKRRSVMLNFLRFALLPMLIPVAWYLKKFKPPVLPTRSLDTQKSLADYRDSHTGSFADLMRKHDSLPDWSRLPASSRPIFKR